MGKADIILDVGVTGDLVGLRGDQELWKRVMGDESSIHAGRIRAVHFVTGVSRDLSPGPVLTNTQLSRGHAARNTPRAVAGILEFTALPMTTPTYKPSVNRRTAC